MSLMGKQEKKMVAVEEKITRLKKKLPLNQSKNLKYQKLKCF
jgi:hypothetical protein